MNNFVWMLIHFFKNFHNGFDSICKSLTEKVMVSFKVGLFDVACFIVKFRDYSGKTGCWKTFLSQVKGHFRVKLKSFSKCFGKHIPVPIREVLKFGVRFHIRVQCFCRLKWRLCHILWQTIQNLFQRVLIKKAKVWNISSRNSWVGLIDIKQLQYE